MVKFSIYDETKLDAQIELVQDVIKDWDWVIWYPNKESLKRSYSREGFTADTRHYVYDNELLVGFLSSTVENEINGILWGSIHLPFIRKGYEHIEKELLDKAINLLKSRGVKKIRTIAMPGWGNTIQILKRYGFINSAQLSYTTLFPAKKLHDKDYQKPNFIQELRLPKERQLLVDAILTTSSSPKEAIESYVDNLIASNSIVAPAIMKKESILGYCFLMKGKDYLEIPGRIFFMMTLSKELSKDLVSEAISELFIYSANKALMLDFDIIWHEVTNLEIMKEYELLGGTFDPCYRYVLNTK